MDPVNPYAAPQAATNEPISADASGNAWRSGSDLVVNAQAELPERCVKCNAPAERRRFQLTWHTPLAYLGLLGGLIPYIILALVLQKKLTVHVGVCRDHTRKRRRVILLGTLGFLAGLGLLIFGGISLRPPTSGIVMLSGFVLLLGSAIYGAAASRIVWPKKIVNQVAWLKGAGPEYLAELPELPAYSRPR